MPSRKAILNPPPSREVFLRTGLLPVDRCDIPECKSSCPICTETFVASDADPDAEKPVRLPCNHIFGEECIIHWFSTDNDDGSPHNTCPLCRRILFAHWELNSSSPTTLEVLTGLTRSNLLPEPPFIDIWSSQERIIIPGYLSEIWIEWAWDAVSWTGSAVHVTPQLRRTVRTAVQQSFLFLDAREMNPMELYEELIITVLAAVQLQSENGESENTSQEAERSALHLLEATDPWLPLFLRFIVNRARGQ